MNRREQRCGKASRSALSSFFDDKRWLERPDRAVDRLASLHATLHSGSGFAETELYHRAARVIRVGSRKGEAGVAIREGQDEGLAMRAIDRERKEMLFAAAAGSGDRSLRWIAEQPKGRPAPSELWARGAARLRDHDEQVSMPDARELSAWLEQARADLTERAAVRKKTHVPLELWVEVAATLESWVADGGLKASRTRARGWAVLRMSGSWGSGCTGKPVSLSCRSWRDLPTAGWGICGEV